MGQTQQNLEAAFAGESQANRKYLAFARKAKKEGHPLLARLFRAAAEAETVHAHNHLLVMNGVGTTAANLEAAIAGEDYEFTEMYPGFIAQAKSDGNQKAEVSFTRANEVEKIHHGLFQKALESLEKGQPIEDKHYFVCQVCGNTVLEEAPLNCPICGAPRDKFKRVD